MPEPEAPKIEFPCEYPIKVLGRSGDGFQALVCEVFERHAPGFDQDSISARSSGKGTFTALTIIITATGPEQLEALHQELIAHDAVHMVI